MDLGQAKWQLLAERKLNLVGTRICIVYCGGGWPYHVHSDDACHGVADKLADAKAMCLEVVAELLEMGVDP